jgi:hypothetical protein
MNNKNSQEEQHFIAPFSKRACTTGIEKMVDQF